MFVEPIRLIHMLLCGVIMHWISEHALLNIFEVHVGISISIVSLFFKIGASSHRFTYRVQRINLKDSVVFSCCGFHQFKYN